MTISTHPLHTSVDGDDIDLGLGTGTSEASKPSIPKRTADFVRAHWKAIGLVALGLVAWRSRRLRPLVKTAATSYLVPTARQMLARAHL